MIAQWIDLSKNNIPIPTASNASTSSVLPIIP